jgi:hypothetical protein
MRFSCSHDYRYHLQLSSDCCYLFAFSFFAYLPVFFFFFFFHRYVLFCCWYSSTFAIFNLRFFFLLLIDCVLSKLLFISSRLLTRAIISKILKISNVGLGSVRHKFDKSRHYTCWNIWCWWISMGCICKFSGLFSLPFFFGKDILLVCFLDLEHW